MDYELAKQLKDAGFPQNQYPNKWEGYWSEGKATLAGCENNYEEIYFPSLSELIEACPRVRERSPENKETLKYADGSDSGDYLDENLGFLALRINEKDKWIAGYDRSHDYEGNWFDIDEQEGSTPEEAVALLWLELNKK